LRAAHIEVVTGTPAGVVRLHVLGGAEVILPDGQPADEVARQPKRLALLAFLALARGARYQRRDVLLATLWPELDAGRARAALRRATYFLRRALGDATIVSRGDELGVAADRLWCDAVAFQAALDAGHLEQALIHYQGDLLAGLFVSSAPEFERWLDAERARLRRAASAAAWDLAEGEHGAGRPRPAAHWARRALALSADDEAAVRRGMTLFARLGDRAAALAAYDDFARHLAADGLDPSAETWALAETLRGGPEPTAPTPPPPLQPNLLAVFPFAVRGGPEVAYLREGIVDLLSAKLDGAGDLRTVDAHALLRHAQLLGESEPDPALARPVARRFGAGAFLLGSVVAAGGRILLKATRYQTAGSEEVRGDVDAPLEDGVFGAVDDLARQLLERGSSSHGGYLGRLAATVTGSLPALKAHLAAERAFRRGRYAEAADGYARAVAGDPVFALGHYRHGAALAACGRLDEARAAAAAAEASPRQLPPHVRLLLSAQAAWLDGRLADAERRLHGVLDARPEDVEAWFQLGRLLADTNPYRGRSAAEGRGALDRAVALDPGHVGALSRLARLAALETDREAVSRFADACLTHSPGGDEALAVHTLRAALSGSPADLEAVRRAAGVARPSAVSAAMADAALVAPDPGVAHSVIAALRGAPAAATFPALPALLEAHEAAAAGDLARAAAALDGAARANPGEALLHRALIHAISPAHDADRFEAALRNLEAWQPDVGAEALARVSCLAGLLARAGRHEDIVPLAETCAQLPAPERAPALAGNTATALRARVALSCGEPAAALEALDAVSPDRGLHLAVLSPILGLADARLLRVEALARLGRPEEAAAWAAGLKQRSPFERLHALRAERLLTEITTR
jgi:DNA-binding SARP family transcriptional activator